MVDFTAANIWTEMVKIANAEPDFVYKDQVASSGFACGYTGHRLGSTDGRGCLVGQALSNLGLTTEELLELDNVGDSNDVLDKLSISRADDPIAEIISNAQYRQDNNDSWSEAIGRAIHDAKGNFTILPSEWETILGVTVLDPDGWDRKNFAEDWARPLTYAEFWYKACMSTIRVNNPS